MHTINSNATSNYNADFLIHNSPFHIHDSPPHSVPLPWHIIQKQRRRHPTNNVEVQTILYITPKKSKKMKIALSHLSTYPHQLLTAYYWPSLLPSQFCAFSYQRSSVIYQPVVQLISYFCTSFLSLTSNLLPTAALVNAFVPTSVAFCISLMCADGSSISSSSLMPLRWLCNRLESAGRTRTSS